MVELAGQVDRLSALCIMISSIITQEHCYIMYSHSNVIDSHC